MDVPGSEPAADAGVRAAAMLADGLRHRMYTYIRAARRPVTREQAATAAGISRKLAAFHLDKLVQAGLLQVSYGTAGALGGRPPKLYQSAGLDIQVSIPARQHDELAGVLIDAVLTHAPGEDARQAALGTARSRGTALGAATRNQARVRGRPGHERTLALAQTALRHWGFEPEPAAAGCLRLRNCPFHPFAVTAPELVCGINQAFLAGFLDGLDTTAVEAVLEPRAGECCVELRART